jgi:hypothetical protein
MVTGPRIRVRDSTGNRYACYQTLAPVAAFALFACGDRYFVFPTTGHLDSHLRFVWRVIFKDNVLISE